MYFLSHIYQSVKTLTALSGVTGSVLAIAYGALGGGTVVIIGGSLCLANSIFNLVEIGKVGFDIKKQIKQLKTNLTLFSEQNDMLRGNVAGLTHLNESFQNEHDRLKRLLTKSERHVNKLEALKDTLTVHGDKLQSDIQTLETETVELRDTVGELTVQVKQFEQEAARFAMENQHLAVNNERLAEQIQKQAKIILDSKQLIQNLAKFGDQYTAFATTLNSDINRLDNTSTDLEETSRILEKLVDHLKHETFDSLDLNNDGVITREEFTKKLGIID